MSRINCFALAGLNALALCAGPAIAQTLEAGGDGEWSNILSQAEPEQPDLLQEAQPELVVRPSEPPPVVATETQSVRVGSVLVDTDAAIDHAIFEAIIEPYLGIEASRDDLARLAQEIAAAARAQGVALAEAWVPDQKVELGIVRVVLAVGVIDEVRIDGPDNAALRELLEPLIGKVFVQDELEKRLMLASDIPAIVARRAELVNENDRRILVVTVEPRPRIRGRLAIDNYGSPRVGPLRGRLSVQGAGLLVDSDISSLVVLTNPADTDELVAASAAYGFGLGNSGMRMTVSGGLSNSQVAPDFFTPAREVNSQYVGIAVSRPLRRTRTNSTWFETQLDMLRVKQETEVAALQEDTIYALSANFQSILKTETGWLRTGAMVRHGLDLPGATQQGDLMASRYNGEATFLSARAWINWTGKPVGDVTLQLAAMGQLAADPLLASEELGFGGEFFGRAFDLYERSGDQGVLLSAELGYEFVDPMDGIKRIQPYLFLDGGDLSNIGDGANGGSLASTGGGIRSDIGPLNLKLETAVPIYFSYSDSTSYDPIVNFQLGWGF